jgi:acylphosphatase
MEATIRRRVEVTGRVQGVGFRYATDGVALDLGLAGWVRNRPDGTVEAVFEGPAQAVLAAVTWCRNGPPSAFVQAVEVHEEPPEDLARFEIT